MGFTRAIIGQPGRMRPTRKPTPTEKKMTQQAGSTPPVQSTSIVRYGDIPLDDVDRVVDEAGRSSSQFWKPPVGETQIRVLPPRVGERWCVVTQQHYAKIPVQGAPLPLVVNCNCPRLMADGRCPLCLEFQRLSVSRKKADRDLAFEVYRAKPRAHLNILVRGQERKGVQIWAFGKGMLDDIAALRKSKGGGDFSNPTGKGFDLLVNRTGTGRNDTEYKLMAVRECSPLAWDENGEADPAKIQAIIDSQPVLSIFAEVPSTEQIEAAMRGEKIDLRFADETVIDTAPVRTVGDALDEGHGQAAPSGEKTPF